MAVAVQNLVDLGSEIPGLALAPVVCGAIVVGGAAGRTPRWRVERWATAGRAMAVAGAVAAACAIVTAGTGVGKEVHQDRFSMYDMALGRRASADQMHALARAAMLRHPSEPYLPFVVATRAVQARDDSPMPWIEATLERARVYGPAHLLLARVVAARSPSQARLEYRLAVEQAPEFFGDVMAEAPRVVGGFDDALEVTPAGRVGVTTMDSMEGFVQSRLPSTCVRLDAEITARAPTEPGPALRSARDALQDLEAGASAPWCEGARFADCVSRALSWASRAEQMLPERCEPYSFHARARFASGDAVGALDELTAAAERVSDRVLCLQSLETLAETAHDDGRAERAVQNVANAGCIDTECAHNLAWAASIEEARGNEQRAHALYKRAYSYAPEDDGLLEAIARSAAAVGLHVEAAEGYAQLARRHPAEAKWARAAGEERNAAARAAMAL